MKILNFVGPVAVVLTALAGALHTDATSKNADKTIPLMGYKHVAFPENCEAVIECSNSGNFFCTSGTPAVQLYRLDAASPASCPVALKRNTF